MGSNDASGLTASIICLFLQCNEKNLKAIETLCHYTQELTFRSMNYELILHSEIGCKWGNQINLERFESKLIFCLEKNGIFFFCLALSVG